MSELLTPFDVEARARVAGLSIKEVCRRAGIAQSTFARWKAGTTSPRLDVCNRIVAVIRAAIEAKAAA